MASLNKMERPPWDCWGVILNEQLDDPDDLSMLDDVAALSAGDVPEFEVVRSCYETDPRLFMVVKLNYYLLDIAHIQIVREVRDQFVNVQQPPASSAVEVRRLFRDDLLIEVDAIAALPD